jgi:hypothetical protein
VRDFKRWQSGKGGYCLTSFAIIARGNYQITLLEAYPCKNIDELKARERYWIEHIKNTVNRNIPTRTYREWQQPYYGANKELILEKRKVYYQANKERIDERKKIYNEANKEQIAEQRKQHREANKEQIADRQKKYYEANKERLAERSKQYHASNKERLAKQQSESITCPCGSTTTRGHIRKHERSQKHQTWLLSTV